MRVKVEDHSRAVHLDLRRLPNSAQPIGRATNAVANVASEAGVADAGSDAGSTAAVA